MRSSEPPAGGAHLAPARVALVGFTILALAAVGLEVIRGDVSTTFEPRTRRPAAVVTDGRRVLEVEARTGRVAATLLALPTTGDERIVAITPRPGALRGLPLLVLSEGEQGPSIWWLDEAGRRRELPDALRLRASAGDGGVVPAAIWSPDGSHVAWLEGTGAGATLRVLAWSADGPREGDERHTSIPLGQGLGGGARLEGWRWLGTGAEPEGTLLASDDRPGLYELRVRRSAGRVTADDARPLRLPGAMVDRAEAGRGPARAPWPRYTLLLPLEAARGPQLRWSALEGGSGTLPLPAGMSGSRTRWWLDAFGELVLVGDGERAWALSTDGSTVEIPGGVVHGAVLERLPSDGGRMVTPNGHGRQME